MRRAISANANVAAVVAVIRLANAAVVRGTRMDRLHEMYLKQKHLKTGKGGTCDFVQDESAFDDQPVLPPSRVLGLPVGGLQTRSLQRQWQPQSSSSSWRSASSPSELQIAG